MNQTGLLIIWFILLCLIRNCVFQLSLSLCLSVWYYLCATMVLIFYWRQIILFDRLLELYSTCEAMVHITTVLVSNLVMSWLKVQNSWISWAILVFFFFLISNIKFLLKTHSPVHRKSTKRQKHQETNLQWSSNTGRDIQEKDGKTRHHSRRVKKKKDLNSIMDSSRQ